MAAQDTSGWNEPELRGEIQRLRLRKAKAKKKYDQAREEASEKEEEVGRLMEKLQDVMVSLDVSREECEGLRQQGPVETSADVNSSAFPSEDELAAVKSTLADRDAELAKAEALEGSAKLVAKLLHAQSVLNQAFDENDRITDPTKLDAAATGYQEVLDGAQEPTLKGRAAAGLAAIAKYQGKKEDVCTHATTAAEHYEAGGASAYLKEVPSLLKKDAKCK